MNDPAVSARIQPLGTLHLWLSLGAAAAVALAVHLGFQPKRVGGAGMWLLLLGCYVPLSAGAVVLLHRSGRLRGLLRYRSGDPSLGVALAALLLAAAWALVATFLPEGDPHRAWLYRVLMLGRGLHGLARAAALFTVVCCEELVWRGFVLASLERVAGSRAWLLAAALFVAAHGPSMFALSDPAQGPNPLVLVAAMGGGLAWGLLAARTGRIAPAVFCHFVASYFATVLFRYSVVG